MAGGKLSPRQKMINMMYLVLTALLAMNISKDILDALTKVQRDLESSASAVNRGNVQVYNEFTAAAAEKPERAEKWRVKAFQVKDVADETFDLIETIKTELIALHGEIGDDGKIPGADKREKAANYLLNSKKMGGEDKGKELREQMSKFRENLIKVIGETNPGLVSSLKEEFSTDPKPINKDGTTAEWEKAEFEHIPLAGVLTFLSSYQAKIRNAEASVISELQKNIDKGTLKFTGVKPVILPISTFVTTGDSFRAEVFLAAYDKDQEPEVILYDGWKDDSTFIGEGRPLTEAQIRNGAGHVRFSASQPGEKRWGGIIRIGGGDNITEEKFWGTYNVAPPSAVISPTAMNVLYRGVDNPLEIGVPGVDPKNLTVSGPGVSPKGDGTYVADVTRVQGTEMKITVGIKDKPGFSQSKTFRIKGLPPATGMVYRNRSTIYSKSAVQNLTVEAEFKDFPFDLNLEVISFDIVVPGFPPKTIRGTKLDGSVRQQIQTLRPGTSITIRNIKAKGPKGINVQDISPISFDVN
ncbi:MAG: gliding motility protein GldM [Cryomorphaceae bacterium]|nr:gliding motility protein GldM [Cryomorphaceae bacterium]